MDVKSRKRNESKEAGGIVGEQRLIDANAIRYGYSARLFSEFNGDPLDGGYVIFRDKLFASKKSIDKLPTIDPVKHGHWVFDERWWYPPKCSVCNGSPDTPGFLGKEDFYHTNFCFCPKCGAKMDAKADYR